MRKKAYLVLEDGSVFEGRSFGADAAGIGELVFNTSMTGYPEILTDPSYNGQIVLMTYPHIGNYGVLDAWAQSSGVKAAGLVARSIYTGAVPPGTMSLDDYLKKEGICAIGDVDTRSVTLRLRDKGVCKAMIVAAEEFDPFWVTGLQGFDDISQRDLITGVAVREVVKDPAAGVAVPENPSMRFAVVDFGIKTGIIDCIYQRNAAVTLFPPTFTAEQILSSGCDALFLSNGPGDPERLGEQIGQVRMLLGKLPVRGICLGHQIITWALGGKTVKMKFGHHGANHPVSDLRTGRTYVTAQNHNYMSLMDSLGDNVELWLRNSNDGSVEGLIEKDLNVVSTQFHPEASPGPHDGYRVFDTFMEGLAR